MRTRNLKFNRRKVCCANFDNQIQFLKDQLKGIHENVSPGLIEQIPIECYGGTSLLKHIAAVSGSKRIEITPYDIALLSSVNQSLIKAGFDSYIFSKTTIVVNIPQICGEERDKIVKQVKRLGEECKISIRNLRRKLRKSGNFDEKSLDKAMEIVDNMLEHKIKELQR